MIIRLTEQLDVPLRERNQLLLAAGFAPSFGERSVMDAMLAPAMAAVETVLKGHEPFPALAVDRPARPTCSTSVDDPASSTGGRPRLTR